MLKWMLASALIFLLFLFGRKNQEWRLQDEQDLRDETEEAKFELIQLDDFRRPA